MNDDTLAFYEEICHGRAFKVMLYTEETLAYQAQIFTDDLVSRLHKRVEVAKELERLGLVELVNKFDGWLFYRVLDPTEIVRGKHGEG